MDPRQLFIDQRLIGMCVHCGAEPSTRDHIPAKVLLDEPYPPDLPVMASCERCNSGASLDEQYVACFLDAVISGTTEPRGVTRRKVSRILAEQPELTGRIASSMTVGTDGTKMWQPEVERVRSVIMKLARGHAAYELYPKIEEPDHLSYFPLPLLPAEQRSMFEGRDENTFQTLPEIGSRAFMRACGARPDAFSLSGGWIIVQPGRYRYAVCETGGILVRIVLSEYLGCEVIWD